MSQNSWKKKSRTRNIMISRFLLLSVLSLFVMLGCARKTTPYVTDEIMEEFEVSSFDFDYLSARSRIVVEEKNGKTTKGTLNLRAKKDSIIWFSLTPGLGIEAARGIITSDKIQIKNRMNGKDIDMTFQEFEESYGIGLSLYLFQNILFADAPFELSYRDRLVRIGQTFELFQRRENANFRSVISAQHGKVMELIGESTKGDGRISATYPEFMELDGQPFSDKILIKMLLNLPDRPSSNLLVNLEISRVDILDDPLSFPFNLKE